MDGTTRQVYETCGSEASKQRVFEKFNNERSCTRCASSFYRAIMPLAIQCPRLLPCTRFYGFKNPFMAGFLEGRDPQHRKKFAIVLCRILGQVMALSWIPPQSNWCVSEALNRVIYYSVLLGQRTSCFGSKKMLAILLLLFFLHFPMARKRW